MLTGTAVCVTDWPAGASTVSSRTAVRLYGCTRDAAYRSRGQCERSPSGQISACFSAYSMQQVLGLFFFFFCGTAVVGSYQSTYTVRVCTPHRPKGSTTDLSHMTCRFAFLRWAGAAACHAAAAGCWIGWLR
eukprot:SAG25_NODE_4245_length_857_cov_1.121372_1_plen_131_part_10